MKPIKLMEREYSTPILGGGILPVMNSAMELGFDFKTLILVASVSCFYAVLRVVQKTLEMKYRGATINLTHAAADSIKTPPTP